MYFDISEVSIRNIEVRYCGTSIYRKFGYDVSKFGMSVFRYIGRFGTLYCSISIYRKFRYEGRYCDMSMYRSIRYIEVRYCGIRYIETFVTISDTATNSTVHLLLCTSIPRKTSTMKTRA